MARLTAATRKKIPTGKFALPGRRFPIHDKQHAATAKSYASRMVKRGQLTSAQKATIDAKANRMLGKNMGGRAGLRRYAIGGPVVDYDDRENVFDKSSRVKDAFVEFD